MEENEMRRLRTAVINMLTVAELKQICRRLKLKLVAVPTEESGPPKENADG